MQLCYVGCTSFKVVENISKTFLFLFYKWKFVPMHIIMNCSRVTVAALFWNQHFQPLSGFENCDDGLRINSKQAWNFDSGSYDYCSIRDGKRFYLKGNNIFFQHHFRSKTIYFSFFSHSDIKAVRMSLDQIPVIAHKCKELWNCQPKLSFPKKHYCTLQGLNVKRSNFPCGYI